MRPRNIIPFGQPVDYEGPRFVGDTICTTSPRAMPQSAARAGQPPARAVLRRLGYAVPIAIAVFCVVWFAGQLLRVVLS